MTGDNGNGKSSIIDAITTALFFRARGTDSRGAGIDDLISKGQKEFIINFIFDMDDHRYEIYRSKVYNGTHKLAFYIDGIDQSSSLKDTQNKIIELLHVDFDAFCDTVLVAQGKSSSFMEKPADKRKDTFIQILRLDEYDLLADYTKMLKKDLNHNLIDKRNRLTTLENFINYKDDYFNKIIDYEKQLSGIDTLSIENEIERLNQIYQNYQTIKSNNELILSNRNNLQNSLKNLENRINQSKQVLGSLQIDTFDYEYELINLQKKQRNIQNEISSIRNDISDRNVKFNVLKNELDAKKKKISNLQNYKESICEFCGNKISEGNKQKYINDIVQSGNEIFNKAKVLKIELDKLKESLNIKDKELSTINQTIDDYKFKMHQVELNLMKKKNIESNLNSDNSSLERINNELQDNLKLELKELPIPYDSYKLSSLKNELSSLKNKESELKENLAIIKDRLKQIETFEQEYEDISLEVKSLEIKLDDYNAIIHAFSKNGIQSYIIENVLPEIEDEINLLLSELTNDKISIQFITTKETKAKTSIDTLDIVVTDGNTSRKYETFSGGEKFRIDFASHVGLARFLARRSNSALGFFILDENLGSQDETAKAIFAQCISKMTKYFEQIMVITHIDDIKDSFTHRIEINKDINGSHVKFLKEEN